MNRQASEKNMEKSAGIIEDVGDIPATAASAVSWHAPRCDLRLRRPFPDALRCANFSQGHNFSTRQCEG